jgi:hypothetical protein
MAASWLIGAVRALRRRAPLLRRRHASRYLTTGELSDLRLNTGRSWVPARTELSPGCQEPVVD